MASIAPLLLAGISLLTAAGGDYETFLALVQTLNIPAIIVASYINVTPTIILGAVNMYVLYQQARLGIGTREQRRGTLLWWAPTILFVYAFLPLPTFLALGVLPFIAFTLVILLKKPERLFTKKKGRPIAQGEELKARLSPLAGRVLIVLLAAMVALVSVASPFWLPPEIIAIKGEPKVSTGYVLKREEEDLVIYWQDGRGVKRYKADRIEYREICRYSLGSSGGLPLIRRFYDPYIIKPPRLQTCPDH